ncbi:MAG: helix-turn-helix transcriptional regulator [Elusimicrobiales bacterium]|nr:helix-turn-helix transcriptional regulator [Elusimicrobiales bacterium]
MNKKNEIIKATDFQAYLDNKLKDKKLKRHYDEYGKQLEIAYQIIKLRKKAKMSQLELAKKIHTTQSNVARIESGQQNFTVNLLNKVAEALGSELKICIG